MRNWLVVALVAAPASVLLGASCWNNTITCSVVAGGCSAGGSIRVCDAGCNTVPKGFGGYTNVTVGAAVAATCTDFNAAIGATGVFSQRNCSLGPAPSPWIYVGTCGTVGSMCCFYDPTAGGATTAPGPNPGYKIYPCQKSEFSAPCTGA